MKRVVDSEFEADVIVSHLEDELRDMSPFFRKLEAPSGALDVSERETWDKRFRMGIRHAASTIEARRRRRGYYGYAPKAPRATSSSPFLLWSGSMLRAASKFTTINANSASIDPDRNYQGPLDAVLSEPFTDIVSEIVPDDRVWDEQILGPRIERELDVFLRKAIGV